MPYRYENINTTRLDEVKETMFVNNIYPDIVPKDGDLYVIVTAGDRLDLMAYDYYGDTSYWWIIATANALPGDSLFPPIGSQLRIPTDIQSVLLQYRMVNINR
jgi:hypothetical protein